MPDRHADVLTLLRSQRYIASLRDTELLAALSAEKRERRDRLYKSDPSQDAAAQARLFFGQDSERNGSKNSEKERERDQEKMLLSPDQEPLASSRNAVIGSNAESGLEKPGCHRRLGNAIDLGASIHRDHRGLGEASL